MNTEDYERQKYKALWHNNDYVSNSAINWGNYLSSILTGKCLDIGCGDCTTMQILNGVKGIECEGLDIVTDQCPAGTVVHCAPAWRMPVRDKAYAYSFSTDVLEHLPTGFVKAALVEIGRVTRVKTYHYIATKPAVTTYEGKQVHLTVKPIEWWRVMFNRYCDVDYELKWW